MKLICPVCSNEHEKSTSAYNAAMKRCGVIYCGRTCAGIGRRHNKTPEQLKAEKAEYDRQRRIDLSNELKIAKKAYYQANRKTILPKMRVYNKKRMPNHVIYCRQPEQRTKERVRRRIKNGLDKIKVCLCCREEKELINFEAYMVFPDGRNYMCKQCEDKEEKEMGVSMREVLQTIRIALYNHESSLTIRDYTPYPYLIEAHKYSLLLKRLTK